MELYFPEENPILIPIHKIDKLIRPIVCLSINFVDLLWYERVMINCDDSPELVEHKQRIITSYLQQKLN